MKNTANVIIYTAWYCSFCDSAKALLNEKKISYKEIPVSKNDAQWKEMEQLSGNKTVPQIFINNKHVGGCNELRALDRSGELSKMIST